MKKLSIYIFILSLLIAPSVFAARVYPADPDAFSNQWHLEKIKAYEAWGIEKGSSEVVVAVIDTGLDINHPDIKFNVWKNNGERLDGLDNDGNFYVDDINGWDFVDGDNDPTPNLNDDEASAQAVNHGTMVAGLIGAVGNNGVGGTGVAWNVKLMPLRALDSGGKGNVGIVIEAIRYAIREDADIINLSFVGPGFDRDLFLVLQEALRKGVLVVAAVGNNEQLQGVNLDKTPLYPVCYTGGISGEDVVLGVAAVDKNDQKFLFSNYGEDCVDISAPGVEMYGTNYYNPQRGFEKFFSGGFAGSSMAAPLVSGTAALIKSINPSYGAQEIRSILLQSADSLELIDQKYYKQLGVGRLDVEEALKLAISGGSAIQSPALSIGASYIVTGPYSDTKPEIQVLLPSGTRSKSFLAYAPNFTGGVRLGAGDVNKDGRAEIVVGAGFGGGPHVRVFKADGELVSSFFAYDPKFRGGVNIAVGDTNGNGKAEIVTAAGPGGGPHIRIFDQTGKAVGGFFAYGKGLRGGANLAVADLDNDGKAEIIVAPGVGTGHDGLIRVFNSSGTLKYSFATYPGGFSSGIHVSAGDLDGDGVMEIITAPVVNEISEVRVYSSKGKWQRAFLVYDQAFKGGINLAVGDIDGDDKAEIITGPGKDRNSKVIVFDGFGRKKNTLSAMSGDFHGGISVGIIEL